MNPILIEDALTIVAQIVAAIQQANATGATTIDPSVLQADATARKAAQAQLDSDLSAGN